MSTPFSCYTVTITDEAAASALDPILKTGDVLRLVTAGTAPIEASCFRLEPTDSGQASADPSGPIFGAILEAVGYPDTKVATDRWQAEGVAALQEVWNARPASPLAVWRGSASAVAFQAIAVGRAFGLSLEACSLLVGQAPTKRSLLIGPMSKAKELDAAAEKADREAAERVKEEAQAVVERTRLRSLAERGWHAIELRSTLTMGIPPLLASESTSWLGTNGSLVIAWQGLEGFEPPALDLGAVRVLDPSELVPSDSRIAAPITMNVYSFLRDLRIERGEIDARPVESFAAEGIDDARQLVAKYAKLLYVATPADGFRRQHIAECLVRGLQIRPDVAADMIWSSISASHSETAQSWDVPSGGLGSPGARLIPTNSRQLRSVERFEIEAGPIPSSAWAIKAIETACVGATKGGIVGVGALLDVTVSRRVA